MSKSSGLQQFGKGTQTAADSLTSNADAVVARAAARAGQQKESSLDVMRHAKDGYWKQREDAGVGNPSIPPVIAEAARTVKGVIDAGRGAYKGLTGEWHSSGDANVVATEDQLKKQIGKDLDNIAKADGALQTVGATFAALTSAEQLVSAPFAKIPFPAFPALRILDMDVGLPHAHTHPPNTPPVPPLMLPSTGPVIPIPFVSGANKTLINGMPAARCGDMGLGIWCGGYVPLYEIILGSASVWVEGSRAARTGVDLTNHCIFSARKGPDDKPLGPFIGFTITGSANVIIGGVPMPSLTNMAVGKGLGALFKGAGRVMKALAKTKIGQKAVGMGKQLSGKIAGKVAGMGKKVAGIGQKVSGMGQRLSGKLALKLADMGKKAKDLWKKMANRRAIKKSGIVGKHADEISKVAQARGEILMFQPVNPAATKHINEGAATKGMDVKAKSDQDGLIPTDQANSPKGRAKGEDWVAKQNDDLQKKIDAGEYTKVQGPDDYDVLAQVDKNGQPVPMTADYDLLAVGSKEPPGPVTYDPKEGYITPAQREALNDINTAVDHPGGKVVHHGPENGYKGEGPKYPITSFEPDGTVRSIDNEPELKDYFNRKNADGYNLDGDNFGWEKGPDGKYK